jgi:VWFA-related protein
MDARWPLPLLLASMVALLPADLRPGGAPQQVPPGPLFSARSDLVVLNVAVTDRDGVYVTGLDRAAFSVYEDGQPQTIELFSSGDTPVTAGLVVDNSGSMGSARTRVSVAAGSFAATSNPQDEIFALVFNEYPFTDSSMVLRKALSEAITANGRTALYDAIAAGLTYLSRGEHARKVLVVVSDGGDNESRTTFDEVRQMTASSNTLIYAVGLPDPLDTDARPGELKRLASATGGQAFFPKETSDVDLVLRRVAKDIRSMYTIGYTPTNAGPDGHFRRIRVTASSPDHRDYRVRTREGYVVEGR